MYKKVGKEYLQETISLLPLPANSDVLTHMPHKMRQEVIFVFLQLRAGQHIKKNLAPSSFDGGLGTRWWRNVDGEVENEEWAASVAEDGKWVAHAR